MGGVCGRPGKKKRETHSGVCWLKLNERDHLENLGVDGRILRNLHYMTLCKTGLSAGPAQSGPLSQAHVAALLFEESVPKYILKKQC
jgi:hypothetical protein